MKVAIYCRLSEEDINKQSETDDSNSIKNQKSMLLQYAMEQGWEFYNIYSEMKIPKMIQFENMNPPKKARNKGF